MSARTLLAGTLALSVLLIPAATSATTAATCARASGRTLWQIEHVRVFATRGAVHACRLGTRRTVRLGKERGDGHVAGIALSGEFVAYWVARQPNFDSTADAPVVVLNVRTRRARKRGDCGPVLSYECRDLVLARNGGVAWTNFDSKGGTGIVWKSDATGTEVELDENPLGPITDLALSGSTVYWMKQDGPHRATLN